MIRESTLPEGFTTEEASKHWLFLKRHGVRIGTYARDLPLLDAVLTKVCEEHRRRIPDEVWERRIAR